MQMSPVVDPILSIYIVRQIYKYFLFYKPYMEVNVALNKIFPFFSPAVQK